MVFGLFQRLFSDDPTTYSPPAGIPSPQDVHELELYKFDACPYCRRVQRVVEKLRLDEVVEERDVRRSSRARDELLDLTGKAQVPCLSISGTPMLESADIVKWLTAYAHHHG